MAEGLVIIAGAFVAFSAGGLALLYRHLRRDDRRFEQSRR